MLWDTFDPTAAPTFLPRPPVPLAGAPQAAHGLREAWRSAAASFGSAVRRLCEPGRPDWPSPALFEIGFALLPPRLIGKVFPPIVCGVAITCIGASLTGAGRPERAGEGEGETRGGGEPRPKLSPTRPLSRANAGIKYWGGGVFCMENDLSKLPLWKGLPQMCQNGDVDHLAAGAPEHVGMGFMVVCIMVLIEVLVALEGVERGPILGTKVAHCYYRSSAPPSGRTPTSSSRSSSPTSSRWASRSRPRQPRTTRTPSRTTTSTSGSQRRLSRPISLPTCASLLPAPH